MDPIERRRILEALLLASPEPLTAQRLARIVPELSARELGGEIEALNAEYESSGRAFRVEEIGGGYQLRTLPELAPWLAELQPAPPLRLSGPALETLAIVAYKQPLTRAEIEHVRGVDVGAVLRSLLERRLVRIAGHREVPGRPILYATTRRFLEVFGLAELGDLPTLREIEELLRERAAEAVEEPAVLSSADAPDDDGFDDDDDEAEDDADSLARSH